MDEGTVLASVSGFLEADDGQAHNLLASNAAGETEYLTEMYRCMLRQEALLQRIASALESPQKGEPQTGRRGRRAKATSAEA